MSRSFAPFAILPDRVLGIVKELTRHLLKRPVVGLCVVGRGDEGTLLVRRGDTGTWALPGGTVEWGETLTTTMARELAEEAGVDDVRFRRVVGVYSRADRDPRFHAVTVVVEADVGPIVRAPKNTLEIREARFFAEAEVPLELAMTQRDFFDAAKAAGPVVFE